MAPEPRRAAKPSDRVVAMESETPSKPVAKQRIINGLSSTTSTSSTGPTSSAPMNPFYTSPYSSGYGTYGSSYYGSSGYPHYPPSYPMNSGDPISWIYSLSYTMSSLSHLVHMLSCHSNSIYGMITSTIEALNRVADAIRYEVTHHRADRNRRLRVLRSVVVLASMGLTALIYKLISQRRRAAITRQPAWENIF